MSFQSASSHLQSVRSERQAATSFFLARQYDRAVPLSISIAAIDWPLDRETAYITEPQDQQTVVTVSVS